MKKFLSVLTAAVCLTACALSLTACGGESGGNDNQTHTAHTWSETYTEDGDRHYQTCDGCDEKNYSNHDYGTGGVCICGKEKPVEIHSHTWSATYTEDGDRHYQTCNGCDEKNYSNHDYGTSGTCVCGKEKPVIIVAVESVALDTTELTLEIDQTETLTAVVKPDNATDKTVTYSVEPAGIVTVDNNGNVTALSAGTAVITASTANGKTATCSVTVNAPVTNADILNALDANCKDGVLKAGFPSSFIYDENKVSNGTWYMTKDQDGNITKAEYAFNYNLSEVDGYYFVNSVVFTNPLSVKDLINGNIANASYSNEYMVSYDQTIQASKQDLTNAICDTVFNTNGTVLVRYMVDDGRDDLDNVLKECRRFSVIEVTDKGVQNTTIYIKKSSSDAEYASKLSDANNYRTYEYKSYTLVGIKLENNDLPF